MLIDSHVNLHAKAFLEDRDDVIKRAREVGVGLMLTICDRIANFEQIYDLTSQHPDIWCSLGIHPHEAKEEPEPDLEALFALTKRDKLVAIGEAGLDYYYDHSPRPIQRQVLQSQIVLARRADLPLILHSREADEDMITMLESAFAEAPFRFLMHCYTSGPELAAKAASLGAYFSVSGIASFKSARAVQEVIKTMPEDRILVETDCPYLAPVPLRGQRNEPAFLPHILKTLADLRDWDRDEAEARTEAAFFKLFDKIPKDLAYRTQKSMAAS